MLAVVGKEINVINRLDEEINKLKELIKNTKNENEILKLRILKKEIMIKKLGLETSIKELNFCSLSN